MLRESVRAFAEAEVGPQAQEFDRKEQFNLPLFKKLGDLGLLGITAPEEHGGSGMDVRVQVVVPPPSPLCSHPSLLSCECV